MKKVSKIVMAGVCATALVAGCLAIAGCGGSSSSSSSSSNTAASNSAANTTGDVSIQKLTVGFDAEYPPYGYLVTGNGDGYTASNGNKYTGFDLDLAKAVCDENGWELAVEPIDWDSKDALLGSGQIDCIWNGFTYEGREDQYAWSGKYMVNAQVVVTTSSSGITTLDDLAGKNVITQKGSAAKDVLDGDMKDLAKTFNKLETIADYNNAFMQLESGAVDAVACDLSIAAYHLAADPDKYVQLDEELSSEHYAVGFALGNEAVADKVTETLKALDEAGTVKELCEKYADQGIDYANWCLE